MTLKIPNITNEVPLCSFDACPSFDGKRCKITGYRPKELCEPAVREMSATIADLRDRLRLLAPYVCKRCGCAPIEIVSVEGLLTSDEFCGDCYDIRWGYTEEQKEKEEAAMSVSRFCRAVAGRKVIP